MSELHHERLDGCHPLVRTKGHAAIAAAAASGHRLFLVRSWSSYAEQMGIYQIGRTQNPAPAAWEETGRVRTKAKPGLSAHNVLTAANMPSAMAFDLIPIDQDGRPLWIPAGPDGAPMETEEQNELRWLRTYGRRSVQIWEELYRTFARFGLDALGDTWGAFLAWDKGHFEEPGWKLALGPLGLTLPGGEPKEA